MSEPVFVLVVARRTFFDVSKAEIDALEAAMGAGDGVGDVERPAV